jgi:hypothetical protein
VPRNGVTGKESAPEAWGAPVASSQGRAAPSRSGEPLHDLVRLRRTGWQATGATHDTDTPPE